ncbi:MAG: C10 family peptidase [Prevotellaceae bacterium]|nr:C10 family peptidase [Candidatus Faecinaster equi]
MRKKLLIIIVVLSLSIFVNGQTRNEAEIVDIAIAKLSDLDKAAPSKWQMPSAEKVDSKLKLRKFIDKPQYKLMGYDNGGFVVVSTDKRIKPVLAYSDGVFNKDNISAGLKWWLGATEEALKRMSESVILPTKTSDIVVEPLIKTKWDQFPPFNNLCPESEEGKCYVGCVATAMAQIIAYNKYPNQVQFTGCYSLDYDPYNYVKVNVDRTYDWDNMLPQYTTGNYTPDQAKAVAELMFDCGLASKMCYGVELGSSAASLDAAYGLAYYFNYGDDKVMYYNRSAYNGEEWDDIILTELKGGRPILYGGYSEDGVYGHAFVLDGVDNEGLYHFNFGWHNAVDNGYYSLDYINTEYGGDFSFYSDMVTGIGQNAPVCEKTYMNFDGLDADIDNSFDEPNFDIIVNGLFNYDYRTFEGYIALTNDSLSPDEDNRLACFDDESLMSLDGYTEITFNVPYSKIEEGKVYHYYIVESKDGETWQRVRGSDEADSVWLEMKIEKIDGKIFANGRDIAALDEGIVIVNGIYYTLDEETTEATVVSRNGRKNTYSGDIIIPNVIQYNETEYKVTAIEESAFEECIDLVSVVVGDNVKTIKDYAFWSSGLEEIEFSSLSKLEEIGEGTFGYTYIESIAIPKSCVSFGSGFLMNTDINKVFVAWEEPCEIDNYVLYGIELGDVTLYVPTGTKSLYSEADGWGAFGEIVEYNPTGIKQHQSSSFTPQSSIYNINGTKGVSKGVNIIKRKKFLE